MMRKSEQLNPVEAGAPGFSASKLAIKEITREEAEAMLGARKEMLQTLRGDIGTALYDALDEKVRFEHASLEKLMETDTRAIETHQKLNKTLPSAYFVERPLDVHFL